VENGQDIHNERSITVFFHLTTGTSPGVVHNCGQRKQQIREKGGRARTGAYRRPELHPCKLPTVWI